MKFYIFTASGVFTETSAAASFGLSDFRTKKPPTDKTVSPLLIFQPAIFVIHAGLFTNPYPPSLLTMDGAPLDFHLLPYPAPYPGTFREPPSAGRPEYIEKIRAEARGEVYRPAARKKSQPAELDPFTVSRLFTIERGNRWMELGEREPEAKMLFGEFWHQGELCILFADTNAGKSVLAVQIADNIARGKKTGPFACTAKPEKVMYVDLELTTTQFYQRYSGPKGVHEFPDNFYRACFNPETAATDTSNDYDNLLIAGLEYKIRQVGATVLIIDNISCLRGGTESAAVALRLMNNLKSLKADNKLSVLILAHTPKRRNPARPLAAEDLHGSKLLINLADSAFAMGKSNKDVGLCYLKQIKQRNTQQIYGEDNVALCRISKTPLSKGKPGNFLHFDFEGYDAERPHIQMAGRHGYNRSLADHQLLAAQITALSAQGLSQRQIALQLNIGLGTVNKLTQRENCRHEDEIAATDEINTPSASLVEDGLPVDGTPRRPQSEPAAAASLSSKAANKSEHKAVTTGATANSPP